MLLFLDDNQEVTIAILPFFHIYGMTTVMCTGLQLGLKLITLPKFEPEMYLKSLTKYKVNIVMILDVKNIYLILTIYH